MKSMFGSGSFYSRWYPRQYTMSHAGDLSELHEDLRPHVQYGAATSKRLARGLFHAMMRFGPKLDREQLLLSRFVGIATEIFAISAACSYAQHLINLGKPAAEVLSLADYFCRSARSRISHHFAGTAKNADQRGYSLTQELLGGKHELLRTGIV
ncbi:MAG: DNA polymerase II, partial [Verrucomicrobiota bacterium]|nr:DNA polymerase II [Verrucomicrobiota bacterium]